MSLKRSFFLSVASTLFAMSASANAGVPESGSTSTAASAQEVISKYEASKDSLERYRLLNGLSTGVLRTDADQKDYVEQMLATELSILGAYERAEAVAAKPPRFPNASMPDPAILSAEPAAIAVARQADGRRVVMVNEAHHVARTRLLTLQLLEPLRRQGFTHLALEALWESPDTLAKRGHAVRGSGLYLQEPLFGEIVREALRLGYRIVRYEPEDEGEEENWSIQARETGQAAALAKILNDDPKAKILVHAGYAHIYRNFRESMGGANTMAMELERLAKANALTVDQIALLSSDPHAPYAETHRIGQALWDKQAHPYTPFALRDREGRSWSISPNVVDISVFAPTFDDASAWLSLDGRRTAMQVEAPACPDDAPCAVAAYGKNEQDDATPADIRLVESDSPATLWLREGCYRLAILSPGKRSSIPSRCTALMPSTSALLPDDSTP